MNLPFHPVDMLLPIVLARGARRPQSISLIPCVIHLIFDHGLELTNLLLQSRARTLDKIGALVRPLERLRHRELQVPLKIDLGALHGVWHGLLDCSFLMTPTPRRGVAFF